MNGKMDYFKPVKKNLTFALLLATIISHVIYDISHLVYAQTLNSPLYQKRYRESFLDPLETTLNFTEIANDVVPVVVSIYSTKIVSSSDFLEKNIVDEELREFFGEKYYSFPVPGEFTQKGSGSGIIVSPTGFILTNLHVIENAETITVELTDNQTFDAKLIGADPLTELAVIKVEATNLQAANLGNSDSLKIGEWVLTIGNPLELNSTVTAGIVSAIGREIDIIDDNFGVENFIQTDATINPGSSGGALVNLRGEVVGINTAIATQSGYSQGYGFAIPINLARQIMKDLIRHGYVVRSYLGISMQDVNEKIAKALGLKVPKGVFIDFVEEDSPAWVAGLREKDVLIRINNQEVQKGNLVQSKIAQKNPGDEILMTVIRKNRQLKFKVVLGERASQIIRQPLSLSTKNYQNLGLIVKSINTRVAGKIKVKRGDGVIVTGVERGSAAFEANINVNDVILEIGDEKITSLYVFNNLMATMVPGNVYIFKIKRQENVFHRFVEAK